MRKILLVSCCVLGSVCGAGVRFDDTCALVIDDDETGMNWILRTDGSQYAAVTEEDAWGKVNLPAALAPSIEIASTRRIDGEDIIESVTIKNTGPKPVELKDASINFPFNDNYPDAKACVTRRCHAHMWPFGSAAWVCCLRMGGAEKGPHLGWMLTQGEVAGYAVSKRGEATARSNFRGVIAFLLPARTLASGEAWTLAWRLFAHHGPEDFKRQLIRRGGLWVEADRYVAQVGERVTIEATSAAKTVQTVRQLDAPGETEVRVEVDGKWTKVELLAVSDYRSFIARRLDFILDHQQYLNEGDARDGAFLPFDNETGEQYRDWEQKRHRYDLDEGRERIGMGIALAENMRDHGYKNPKALPALEKYARFIRTRLQREDYKTFSEIARPKHRIYNYAWVVRFYFDMFDVTGETKYLDDACGTAKALFREGGHTFYLIEMPVAKSLKTLRQAGRGEDADALLADYRLLAENIMKYGLEVPKFEVNYEQSIIAPAANFLVEMYLATREQKYLDAAQGMMGAVEAFNGMQPSWHLNNIAIRHWDGYWFGKRENYGDTFPHYWSCITADLFGNLAEATGQERYRKAASAIVKANLGLFTEDGRGGAAYLYPNRLNGKPGRYLEPMANDQDWALVFASRWLRD